MSADASRPLDQSEGLDEVEIDRLGELCGGIQEGDEFSHEYILAYNGRNYRVGINKNPLFVAIVATSTGLGNREAVDLAGLSFWYSFRNRKIGGCAATKLSEVKAFLQGYQVIEQVF